MLSLAKDKAWKTYEVKNIWSKLRVAQNKKYCALSGNWTHTTICLWARLCVFVLKVFEPGMIDCSSHLKGKISLPMFNKSNIRASYKPWVSVNGLTRHTFLTVRALWDWVLLSMKIPVSGPQNLVRLFKGLNVSIFNHLGCLAVLQDRAFSRSITYAGRQIRHIPAFPSVTCNRNRLSSDQCTFF